MNADKMIATVVTPKTVCPNTLTANADAITSASGVVATSIQEISESTACGQIVFTEAEHSKARNFSSLPDAELLESVKKLNFCCASSETKV